MACAKGKIISFCKANKAENFSKPAHVNSVYGR